ncbi:hypothetical protein CYMTET_29716 [Cymbomonas tetramitiformis]|uniref:Uncharacterized protein n=1 Tax=Cymbomonas tetramitiformis TaxID=36881 RepID=A0AAE0FKI6_9CHLO|nr:hypothetical protein CYMTET_29716 [Cymbomonas tetramitiformis]
MDTSEAPVGSTAASDAQPNPPPVVTAATPCVEDEDHLFTEKPPANKRKPKGAPKKPAAPKKPKSEKPKAVSEKLKPKQQPPMSPVEVEHLIEARLKRTSQFEGTISKNEDIWKILTVEHNTKFNVARLFTSLRKRYSVETEAYRAYFYSINKEWTGMSTDEKQEQSELPRPKHADLFEKYNYNQRPLCIPETLYDGEVACCNFQQNPDAEDLTLGDEDNIEELLVGDDAWVEGAAFSTPACVGATHVKTPSTGTTPVDTSGAPSATKPSATPITPVVLADISFENLDQNPSPPANATPTQNPATKANPNAIDPSATNTTPTNPAPTNPAPTDQAPTNPTPTNIANPEPTTAPPNPAPRAAPTAPLERIGGGNQTGNKYRARAGSTSKKPIGGRPSNVSQMLEVEAARAEMRKAEAALISERSIAQIAGI